MPSIYSYQKFIDSQRTVEINLPTINGERQGTELATVDGVTYISLPDGVNLSADQPAEIATSVSVVTLTSSLRSSIKAASPSCRLIAQRMIDQIRAAYSIDDEMYFARIGVGAATGLYLPDESEMQEMTIFGEFVESVRQWGRDERAALGV